MILLLFKNVPETINIDVGLSLILTLYEHVVKLIFKQVEMRRNYFQLSSASDQYWMRRYLLVLIIFPTICNKISEMLGVCFDAYTRVKFSIFITSALSTFQYLITFPHLLHLLHRSAFWNFFSFVTVFFS